MYNQQMHQRIAERLSALRDVSDTELTRVEEAIDRAQSYAEALLEEAREPLLVIDSDRMVLSVNRAFCNTFQVSPETVESQQLYKAAGGRWNIPSLKQLIEERIPKDTKVHDFELDHEFPDVGPKKILINACSIPLVGNRSEMVLLAFEDVTELKSLESTLGQAGELQAANEELQKEVDKLRGAVEVHLQGREAAETQLKKATAELQTANSRLEKAADERKQAEEEIRSLEELIENVFQSIQDRLVTFGKDLRFTSKDKS